MRAKAREILRETGLEGALQQIYEEAPSYDHDYAFPSGPLRDNKTHKSLDLDAHDSFGISICLEWKHYQGYLDSFSGNEHFRKKELTVEIIDAEEETIRFAGEQEFVYSGEDWKYDPDLLGHALEVIHKNPKVSESHETIDYSSPSNDLPHPYAQQS